MPKKKQAARKSTKAQASKRQGEDFVTVETIKPGYTVRLKATMYNAMRRAMLKIIPTKKPGLTHAEIREGVVPHLPQDLFPGGAKAGWWAKTVQLDLEAKGILTREKTKPLRWHRRSGKVNRGD